MPAPEPITRLTQLLVKGGATSIEENKANVRRFVDEVMNQRRLELVDALFAEDFVNHAANWPSPDREGIKQGLQMVFAAFPDLKAIVEDVVAEGDKVAFRYSETYTHLGEMMGLAPTGKRLTTGGLCVSRFVEGRCVESWQQDDTYGFLEQVGALPALGQARAG